MSSTLPEFVVFLSDSSCTFWDDNGLDFEALNKQLKGTGGGNPHNVHEFSEFDLDDGFHAVNARLNNFLSARGEYIGGAQLAGNRTSVIAVGEAASMFLAKPAHRNKRRFENVPNTALPILPVKAALIAPDLSAREIAGVTSPVLPSLITPDVVHYIDRRVQRSFMAFFDGDHDNYRARRQRGESGPDPIAVAEALTLPFVDISENDQQPTNRDHALLEAAMRYVGFEDQEIPQPR